MWEAVEVRLIDDRTGWTDIGHQSWDTDDPPALISKPVWDSVQGGFGQDFFRLSGERDEQGRLIYRTRVQ